MRSSGGNFRHTLTLEDWKKMKTKKETSVTGKLVDIRRLWLVGFPKQDRGGGIAGGSVERCTEYGCSVLAGCIS